ncbi:ROK family protein [Alicyclobacillus curvatus]|jgi:glucokinase|nr:ROK family protein [Alicyclobacillus curvatus]
MSYVIGLDVGGSTVKAGVFNGSSQSFGDIRLKTYSSKNTREEIITNMATAVRQLMEQARGLRIGQLAGIGIGVPGFVNSRDGVVMHASNLSLHNVNLKQWFEEEFSVPCVVQGDARVGALAEREFGAAKGRDSLLYVVIGTGVGSGMILDGKVYEGVHSVAGEIGHTIVQPDGNICACGKRGCLETLVSGPMLIRAYQRRVGPQEITAKTLSERATAGEPDAVAVFRQAAQDLAFALSNYCTILDPSIVVIGGGVSLAGPVLFEPLREFFSVYASALASRSIKIVPAQLGDRSGVVGASLLVKEFLANTD